MKGYSQIAETVLEQAKREGKIEGNNQMGSHTHILEI